MASPHTFVPKNIHCLCRNKALGVRKKIVLSAAKSIFRYMISTFHIMKHTNQSLKFTFHIMKSRKECGLTMLVDRL